MKTFAQSGDVVAATFRLFYDGAMRVEESPDEGLVVMPRLPVQGRAPGIAHGAHEKNRPLRLV